MSHSSNEDHEVLLALVKNVGSDLVYNPFAFNIDDNSLVQALDVCHAYVYELDIQRMIKELSTNEMDIVHDIVGIYKNLDQEACVMNNCYVPRYKKSRR